MVLFIVATIAMPTRLADSAESSQFQIDITPNQVAVPETGAIVTLAVGLVGDGISALTGLAVTGGATDFSTVCQLNSTDAQQCTIQFSVMGEPGFLDLDVVATWSTPSCPAGFSLSEDQSECVQAAGSTNTTCAKGQLTPDGLQCYLAARVVPQEGVVSCPDGYSLESGQATCVRLEPASQGDPRCPEGSRGVPGDCYVLVARGPGTPSCPTGGTPSGSQCVIIGDPPVRGPAFCPVSPTVFEADLECYTLIFRPPDSSCQFGTTPDPNGTHCRRLVDLIPGALQCEAGFGLRANECVRFVDLVITPATCPIASVEDANGNCRRKVAEVPGDFFCEDSTAQLQGQNCVFTTQVIVEPQPDLFVCDTGAIANIGSGSSMLVVCLLDLECLDGVLSADGRVCVSPPSFLNSTATEALRIELVSTAIEVRKQVADAVVPDVGAETTYFFTVANVGDWPMTISSMVDDKLGDLNGQGTCQVGARLAPDATYDCELDALVPPGTTSHTNTVTATADPVDELPIVDVLPGTRTDSDSKSVDRVATGLSATKVAAPASVPDSGGDVTFTFGVDNTGAVGVVIDQMVDSVFGLLAGQGTCTVGQTLQPGQSYTCAVVKRLVGNAAVPHRNTLTVTATTVDERAELFVPSAAGTTAESARATATLTATATTSVTFIAALPPIDFGQNLSGLIAPAATPSPSATPSPAAKPPAASSPAQIQSPLLAFTGRESSLAFAVGVTLLGLGALALGAARRRDDHQ